MAYKFKEQISNFDPRNPELSFLASEVAVDICNYRLCRRNDDASVKYLSLLLNKLTQGDEPRIKKDIEVSVILFYAIPGRKNFERYWKERGSHVDEVLLQTNLVAKDLRDLKSLSDEKLKTLENFCINLSKELMSHYNTYYGRGRYRLIA